MKRQSITLFGNFGTQNLGNEYTLKAILHNVRKAFPNAALSCVCPGPQDASATHHIPAFQMSSRYAMPSRPGALSKNPLVKLLRRVFVRLPLELVEWFKAFRILKGTGMLVMTGTGMLGDFGIGPLELHYEILKWALLAKVRGCKLLFVSVGAGPLAHPVSRLIVKAALSLADYRSYRDTFSKDYLGRIGFETGPDRVYPDLAFSLRPDVPSSPRRHETARVVGVGLMDYYGRRSRPEEGEDLYRRYLEKMTAFVGWLLDRDYTVQLLIGDVSYDTRIKGDLRTMLRERAPADGAKGEVVEAEVSSVEQLIAQLAKTDVVVATRFHNIALALMLNKPVVALSYHEKVAALMSGIGLSEYCQEIDAPGVDDLVERFTRLERNARTARSLIERKAEEYRNALDEQYARLAGLFE
jgi:polysaccharide pyruvyl transferase WcaK-like protein